MTHIYVGVYTMGCPQASDDIAEVRWFGLDELEGTERVYEDNINLDDEEATNEPKEVSVASLEIVEEHAPLWEMVASYIKKNFPVKKGKKTTDA